MDLLKEDTFWSQYQIPILRDFPPPTTSSNPLIPPAETRQQKAEESEISQQTDISTEPDRSTHNIHPVPLRIKLVIDNPSETVSTSSKVLHELLQKVKKMKMYVLAGCDYDNIKQGSLTTWYFDTGAEISQISLQNPKHCGDT